MAGRVVQGRLRAGERLVVMPLEDLTAAARIERNGAPARSARAGDNVDVVLSNIDPARLSVGNVLCRAGDASTVPSTRRFTAQIVTLPGLEVRMRRGGEVVWWLGP